MKQKAMESLIAKMEDCDRFNCATGILGRVISICSELIQCANTAEERQAIVEFETPYGIMRASLTMEDTEKIDWVFEVVKPLVYGNNPRLNLEYILGQRRIGGTDAVFLADSDAKEYEGTCNKTVW